MPYQIPVNVWMFDFSKAIASPGLTSAMLLLIESYLVVFPVVTLFLLAKRDKRAYSYAASVVALYAVSELVKFIVREPRPCNIPGLSINKAGCDNSFSFPSNHATVLVGSAVLLKGYRAVEILYVAWIVAVLFGKVYLGQHYFTDIIGGAVIGIIVAYVIYRMRRPIENILNRIFRFVK